MDDRSNALPWMTAWIDLQRKLVEQAPQIPGDGGEAMRRLYGFGGEYVGIAGDWSRLFAAPGAGTSTAMPAGGQEAMRALFADRYRQSFAPEIARIAVALEPAQKNAAVMQRWQAAIQRYGLQVAAIANDASRRLSAALLSDDVSLPPVTSLKQLHALWVDCGEAAYAAAAHGEEFAGAQAELLAAWVETCAAARQAQP
jgi:hypothetical protein